METEVNPIPQGYHSITPYLMVSNAAEAVEFYKKAFDAKEIMKTKTPSGEIGHCEMQIGDSRFMFSGLGEKENPNSSVSLLIYVKNVDEFFSRAIAAGAEEMRPVANQFYGDRMGTLKDPFGHLWHIGTHVEDVSEEEMQKRAQQAWQQH